MTVHVCYRNLLDKTLSKFRYTLHPIHLNKNPTMEQQTNNKTKQTSKGLSSLSKLVKLDLYQICFEQKSANYESIKMYISRQMWLANSIFAPDHTPSLHIFASYLP